MVAHALQNAASLGLSRPQLGQIIEVASLAYGASLAIDIGGVNVIDKLATKLPIFPYSQLVYFGACQKEYFVADVSLKQKKEELR